MNEIVGQIQFIPILLAIFAGLSNGSYLSPLKKGNATNSFVWIIFAIITFLALPLLALVIALLSSTFSLPHQYYIYILLTGLIYGSGMYLLTKSIQYIGLGIPFALSIATGTLSGSLFSILVSGHFSTMVNDKTLLSYLIFIVSIFLYSLSLSIRDKNKNKMWLRGLLLCLISSILCASQGACLSYFANYFKAHGQGFEAQLIPWSLIFISCSIVFIISHYTDGQKIKGSANIIWTQIFKTAIVMSILYSISVVLYTAAITMTGSYSEQYLWVIFMGSIIFASTICSYIKGEWKSCSLKGNLINFIAIFFLLVSVILLTLSV